MVNLPQMAPDNPSSRKEIKGPSVLTRMATLGIAFNLLGSPEAQAQAARDEVTAVMEREAGVVATTEKNLNTPEGGNKNMNGELIAESDLKSGLIDIAENYPGKKFIGRLKGNGDREVLIYVPEGFDSTHPAELLYHFHGKDGELSKKGEKILGGNRLVQILDQTEKAGAAGENIIVIYPLSEANRGTGGYDSKWMEPGTNDDMTELDQEVREKLAHEMNLPNLNIEEVTLQGHSAGGKALSNVMKSGFKAADKVIFLDASYGNWGTQAYNVGKGNNPDIEFTFVTIPDTGTTANANSLKGRPGVKVIEAKGTHGGMNENYFLGENQKEKRKKPERPEIQVGKN